MPETTHSISGPGSGRFARRQTEQRVRISERSTGWSVVSLLPQPRDEKQASLRSQTPQRKIPRPNTSRSGRGAGTGARAIHRTPNQGRQRRSGQRPDHWGDGESVPNEGATPNQQHTSRGDHRWTLSSDQKPDQAFPRLLLSEGGMWSEQAGPPLPTYVPGHLSAVETRHHRRSGQGRTGAAASNNPEWRVFDHPSDVQGGGSGGRVHHQRPTT